MIEGRTRTGAAPFLCYNCLMSSWSTRRRLAYFLALIIAIALIAASVFFVLFYKAPTCFDGKQNGSERGVDCGGSCTRLCPADFAAPKIQWAYSQKVVSGVYNSLAYVENPNPSVEATNLDYVFRLYDTSGVLVAERTGSAFVPAGQKLAIFEGGIRTGERIPYRTTFEFTSEPAWRQGAQLSKLRVVSVDASEGVSPRAEARVKNEATFTQGPLDAFIVLYDVNGNRVAFSKTVVDSIAAGQTATLSYTWPEAFLKPIVKKEVLLVAHP